MFGHARLCDPRTARALVHAGLIEPITPVTAAHLAALGADLLAA
ncbi:hypothetical protein [Saccharothrix longispora]|nr:hypothetical protein [Saccharothrix longispora]MDU0292946.1 hypothetical protein [Saccharothrix longispora]